MCRNTLETIWQFRTKDFTVTMTAEHEDYLDLSWDDTGEVTDKLNSGEYVAFTAKCAVSYRGREIAADYLGNCIYSDPKDFRDHIGARGGYGSYFRDMVRTAIEESRAHFASLPKLRAA